MREHEKLLHLAMPAHRGSLTLSREFPERSSGVPGVSEMFHEAEGDYKGVSGESNGV